MKEFIQHRLGQFGFEIRQTGFDRDVMDFIVDRDIDVVMDVGANVGQFAKSLRARGYREKIVSFEPVRAVYTNLTEAAAGDDDWYTNNFALGAKAGQTTIHVADSTVFSSILPATTAAAEFDDGSAQARAETIEVRTLDQIMPAISGNILLKIDTQGFEKQVLEGGRRSLGMMKGILMELPIIHLYEATWQFHEAIDFMRSAGFVPAQMHAVNYHPVDRVSMVEVDCLFRPHDKRFD